MKKRVVLFNDFAQGIMWFYDENDNYCEEPFDIIKNDNISMDLARQVEDLYFSYFTTTEYETSFDEVKEKENRPQMVTLISKLYDRLNEINDGSYEVFDETIEDNKFAQN